MQNKLKMDTFEDLTMIRDKSFKEKHGIFKLIEDNGLQMLFNILEKNDEKCWDVALSILGNCLTDNFARIKILQLQKIETCCDILKKVEKESLKNRASRVIGNLAQCATCRSIIHEDEDTLKTVVSLLSSTTDLQSIVTHIRTVRLLSNSEEERVRMLELGCLRPILKLLKVESPKILDEALKATFFYIQKFSKKCILQLVEEDAIDSIVSIITKYPKTSRSNICVSLIYKISNLELLNPYLGNAGAIHVIVDDIINICNAKKKENITSELDCFKCAELNNKKVIHRLIKSLDALCISSQHFHNRNVITNTDGLSILIDALDIDQFNVIHDRVISALTFYLYVESNIEIMEKKFIVQKLMVHLVRVSELPPLSEPFKLNDNDESMMFDYIQQYFTVKNELKKSDHKSDDVNKYDESDKEVVAIMSLTQSENSANKYSIHSPTFKNISNINNDDLNEENYNVGNIWDAAPLIKDWSPYISPSHSGSNFSSPFHISSSSSVSETYSPLSCTSYDDFTLVDTVSEIDSTYACDNSIMTDIDDGFSVTENIGFTKVDETIFQDSTYSNDNLISTNFLLDTDTKSEELKNQDALLKFHKQFSYEKNFVKKYESLDMCNVEKANCLDSSSDMKKKRELDDKTFANIKKSVEEDLKIERNFNLNDNIISEQKTINELIEAGKKKKVPTATLR